MAMYNWAVNMVNVISTVSTRVAADLTGLAGIDGAIASPAVATQIKKAFKDAEYSPYEQTPGRFVIESKESEEYGIVIEKLDTGIFIFFYNDNV